MDISAFNPIILTPQADPAIELFEALGFERRHQKDRAEEQGFTSNSLKNASGFGVDVALVPQMPQTMVAIRMSVDDFDEAYELLTERGFKNAGGEVTDTGTSKAALMMSPTGFAISLSQHIKE